MILLYPDIMGDYICQVLRCNEPHVSWQMEQPILFFISYINVTDVCVTESDVIRPYYFIYVIWFKMLLWNHAGIKGYQALVLWAVI